MVRIKVCGITMSEQAVKLADLGVWAIGCIMVPGSPRYVSPALARKILMLLPPHILKVGVFQNEDPAYIIRVRKWCGFDLVQLHGNESPEYCRRLGRGLIKAFGIEKHFAELSLSGYKDVVDYFLFDTKKKGKSGGTGTCFPWEILPSLNTMDHPVIVAGGLNEKNIVKCQSMFSPFAFDLNSGVEVSPGHKDVGKVEKILHLLHCK